MAKKDDLFEPGPDDVKDDGNTDKESRPKRPPKRSSSRKKGDVFTADDCTAKIYQVYTLLGKVMKTSSTRREKDFAEEGAALSRLSEKYPIVGAIMKMLDPLFFLIGTANKFNDHVSEFTARRKEEKRMRKLQEQGGAVTHEIVSEQSS